MRNETMSGSLAETVSERAGEIEHVRSGPYVRLRHPFHRRPGELAPVVTPRSCDRIGVIAWLAAVGTPQVRANPERVRRLAGHGRDLEAHPHLAGGPARRHSV